MVGGLYPWDLYTVSIVGRSIYFFWLNACFPASQPGAMVDQQGTLRIFVNGRQMAKGPTIQTQVRPNAHSDFVQHRYTLWLFDVAMENGPFIEDF